VRYVLDTNVVARLLDGDERVTARLADVSTDDVGMPLVVLAELLFGAKKSARRDANLARLERFAAGASPSVRPHPGRPIRDRTCRRRARRTPEE
jgi:tRNA(fMet)-specific endonuclease VapC